MKRVSIDAGSSAAALEVMSRFAADPRWLITLPPTVSPSSTSERPGLLEHPDEAFAYYRKAGVETVVCEEKHMGSRAIVVLCRDAEAAKQRFGVEANRLDVEAETGVIYTRTGRPFFNDRAMSDALLERLRAALFEVDFWTRLQTDWVCLDCELMPWSVKAGALLREQYAPVGVAGTAHTQFALEELRAAEALGAPVAELRARTELRADAVSSYRKSYAPYVWPVQSLDDLRLAPFHVLASEGQVHSDKPHSWHLGEIDRICEVDPIFQRTERRFVDLSAERSVADAVAWWEAMTQRGGEGMVVKPAEFLVVGEKGLLQPAIKCRGPEYLRLIYGPEYRLEGNLERLRKRGLGRKRSLALRELALGLESLHRFVEQEPLRRVHECVFAVLALEASVVDPRL